jgi:hypothetical protein
MSNNYNNAGDYLTFKGKVEREGGIFCQKVDVAYHYSDSRLWSAIINPQKESIFVTCHINKSDLGEVSFDVLADKKEYMNVDHEFVYDVLEPLINLNLSITE